MDLCWLDVKYEIPVSIMYKNLCLAFLRCLLIGPAVPGFAIEGTAQYTTILLKLSNDIFWFGLSALYPLPVTNGLERRGSYSPTTVFRLSLPGRLRLGSKEREIGSPVSSLGGVRPGTERRATVMAKRRGQR